MIDCVMNYIALHPMFFIALVVLVVIVIARMFGHETGGGGPE